MTKIATTTLPEKSPAAEKRLSDDPSVFPGAAGLQGDLEIIGNVCGSHCPSAGKACRGLNRAGAIVR
jgi:hypothetical protein